MAYTELLNDCRSCFEKAQDSWDKYFSKWEVMAQNEEISEEEEDERVETEDRDRRNKSKSKQATKRIPTGREPRKKPKVNVKKGRRVTSICKIGSRDGGNKEVHSKMLRGGTEIIHTPENQTNLEFEAGNDKHFEADLKAIFIEILTENKNRFGMFSVLSRTFSVTLDSIIMKRSGFSMGPAGEDISRFRGGFLRGNPPPVELPRERETLRMAVLREGPPPFRDNQLYGNPESTALSHREISRECVQPFRLGQAHLCTRINNEREFGGRNIFHASPTPVGSNQGLNACVPWNSQSVSSVIKSDSAPRFSPKEMFSRMLSSPSADPVGNNRARKCMSEKPQRHRKRKGLNPSFGRYDSDDDDEELERSRNGSPRRFLKIFCTPKRPKKCPIVEDSPVEKTKEDDEDCFTLIDRVKK